MELRSTITPPQISPLTPLQQGMLVRSIDQDQRSCYVIQTVFSWEEQIDLTAFEAAWRELAIRHEVLRSRFQWRETPEPSQFVEPTAAIDFRVLNGKGRDEKESEAELRHFLDSDLERGFALFDVPPWRVTAIQSDRRVTAVWTFHHLLLDGRSHIVLLRELLALYDGFKTGIAVPAIAEVPHRAHAEWLAQQDFAYAEAYWRQYLAGVTRATAFPAPDQRTALITAHSNYESHLGPELTSELRSFASSTGTSIGNIIQTSWAFVLGWLANETDVVIGAVRACRKSGVAKGQDLVGLMINTLPLRVHWDASTSISTVLKTVARDWHDFRKYEQTPLSQIQGWTGLPLGSELFCSVVSYSAPHFLEAVLENEQERKQRLIWIRQTTPYCSLDVGLGSDNTALSLSLPEQQVEFNLAGRLPGFLAETVRAVIRNPNGTVGGLSALSPDDRRELIFGVNARWEPTPPVIDWIHRIQLHAAGCPDELALQSMDETVSWHELESRSDQVAGLLQRQGIETDDLVAVLLPRSPEFVWTCLGILKAGAAYLPVDVKWPQLRISTVLTDAQPAGTVTNHSFFALSDGGPGPFWQMDAQTLSNAPPFQPRPTRDTQLAYVIYTSGSSGTPKGVEITQGGLQNLIDDAIESFSLTRQDRGSFLSNTAFDASVHEVWPLLAAGASVHIPDPALLPNPVGLLRWLDEQDISISFVSVIVAEAMVSLARGRTLALRYLLTGGDQLRMAAVDELSFQLVNEYGPTEYSVVATRYPVTKSFDGSSTIPIGKPLRGTRAYVMNGSQQLLPRGLAGELVLAGNGLARGYRNHPELTAEKFVANPIAEEPAMALYRTGDLVRWHADGNLEFLGRIDSQVKLRGFRIELGEIEASLLKHASVREAVVILKNDPAPRLVAFVVTDETSADDQNLQAALSEHLGQRLPGYMLPAHFVLLAQLSVNTSGKYDRKQLAQWHISQTAEDAVTPLAFESETGKEMADIWREVLSVPCIQPNDRFLSLGGTSLSIIKLICAIDQKFGAEIPVSEFFRDPRPDDLARLIRGTVTSKPQALVYLSGPKPGAEGNKSPLYFIPGAGGGVHWFRGLAEELNKRRPVIGIELLALSAETQAAFSVERAADEMASLITAFEPGQQTYSLCGYSGGGLLALECARRLRQQGAKVITVFLLDTYPPPMSNSKLAKVWRWINGWWSLPPEERLKTLWNRVSWFQQHSRASTLQTTQAQREVMAMKQIHIDAFMRHRLEPYDQSVNLFFAANRPLSVRSAPHHNWKTLLTGPFEITELPGDHYSLLRAENARRLAGYFSAILGREEEGEPPQPVNVYTTLKCSG